MKIFYLSLVAILFIFVFVPFVKAQNIAEGIATDITVDDKEVPEGSIISLSDGKYRLSTIPYDGTVYGVVVRIPAVAFKTVGREGMHSVVTSGKTMVRVSTKNGVIQKGDLITTSSIPGVAQKVKENGYIVGIAEEEYTESDPDKIGLIYTSLHLNFGTLSSGLRENLISSLLQGARAPFSSPINALRYVVAGFIATLSFGGGFWFFGRASTRGVEAVGRNPLARRYILVSVLMNVMITIGVMGFGVALAYMVLVI